VRSCLENGSTRQINHKEGLLLEKSHDPVARKDINMLTDPQVDAITEKTIAMNNKSRNTNVRLFYCELKEILNFNTPHTAITL